MFGKHVSQLAKTRPSAERIFSNFIFFFAKDFFNLRCWLLEDWLRTGAWLCEVRSFKKIETNFNFFQSFGKMLESLLKVLQDVQTCKEPDFWWQHTFCVSLIKCVCVCVCVYKNLYFALHANTHTHTLLIRALFPKEYKIFLKLQ